MKNCAGAMASSAELCKKFFRWCPDRGVYFAPSAYEICFISAAHTGGDLARAAEAICESIRALWGGREKSPLEFWVSLIQRRVVLPRCIGAFRVGGFCADSLGSARGAEIFGTCGAHWQGGIRGAELKFCREK